MAKIRSPKLPTYKVGVESPVIIAVKLLPTVVIEPTVGVVPAMDRVSGVQFPDAQLIVVAVHPSMLPPPFGLIKLMH